MTQAFDDQEIETVCSEKNLNSFLGLPTEIQLLNAVLRIRKQVPI
jgi:hypothetical protein